MNIATDSVAKGVRGDAILVLVPLLARISHKAARMRFGAIGAWPGQIPIILCLLAEEGLSQKELIKRTRIEQSTMAEHLDRMDRDGLIYRVRDKRDGRVFRIFLSDKVKVSSDWLISEMEEGTRMYTVGISGKDLEACSRTLAKIIGNMEKYTNG